VIFLFYLVLRCVALDTDDFIVYDAEATVLVAEVKMTNRPLQQSSAS